ncbi:Biotin-requiring enzyme [Aeromicrobium marinum DSM 15272]|uniref:Biotin-requiring enzyme n=1 Tax=Aeromicrobium marinum DSM 15272 TaxID=585531 RepID=E2SBC0_9ACTN|nr:biotin/lipoyl-binding carrier protein [Aeromicrobium marinum]EFQ83666.1 Biotin-requiring enzyme [Aeromicrobium marinum DSM 15272]
MIEARADIVASVWKLLVREGDPVGAGDQIAVLESMKMEIPVVAPVGGHVTRVCVDEGQIVQEGDAIVEIDSSAGA